jgi:hypothetical protein
MEIGKLLELQKLGDLHQTVYPLTGISYVNVAEIQWKWFGFTIITIKYDPFVQSVVA